MEIQTYSEFSPTALDPKGLALPDRQDWLVAPVSQTRDSGVLERSNFAVALESFGGESETVEVHRFGHWGPGWFEVILCHPTHRDELESTAAALADYPVLDDSHYSDMELTEASECWGHYGCSGFVEHLSETLSLSEVCQEWLDELDCDPLWSLHLNHADNPYYDDYGSIAFGYSGISRDRLATFIREQRKAA